MVYTYMVRCTDESLYTGITKNMGHRMREHYYKKKHGAKYTKSRQVRSLEMVWETENWSHAAKLEFRIKQLRKPQKEELLSHPEKVNQLSDFLQEGIFFVPHPEYTLEMYLDEDMG